MTDTLDKVIILGAMAGAAIGGYLIWQSFNKAAVRETAGVTNYNVYTPAPDVVYPDHPFQDLPVLDTAYDAGWNFEGWLRSFQNSLGIPKSESW